MNFVVPESPSVEEPLSSWLDWLEGIHPVSIDMGLERVGRVADRLKLRPVTNPLVLVGGTNGKGSTVAMLAAIYGAAGYRVGAYSSPHIHDFRERISVRGRMAEEQDIVDALAFVESARKPETLTYFEYTTLAAMRVFSQTHCDVYLMEVGLGGRLDATNIWDADCAVVTSIAQDHEAYLGSDLSVIATEKAAIGRSGSLLVVGEKDPPESLFKFAGSQGMRVEHVGAKPAEQLPETSLLGEHQRRNAGCAVAVVEALKPRLPINDETVQLALLATRIPARFEQINMPGYTLYMDVAHNPAGALALREAWDTHFPGQKVQLIFACLEDKDLSGIVQALAPVVAVWHCLELHVPRALPAAELAKVVDALPGASYTIQPDAESACAEVMSRAKESNQPILVAGSFYTIAAVKEALERLPVG